MTVRDTPAATTVIGSAEMRGRGLVLMGMWFVLLLLPILGSTWFKRSSAPVAVITVAALVAALIVGCLRVWRAGLQFVEDHIPNTLGVATQL